MGVLPALRPGRWMGHVYALAPQPFVAAANRAISYGTELARRSVPITQLKGRLADGSQSARVIVVDPQPTTVPLIQSLFEKEIAPEPLATSTWRELPEILDNLAPHADLVLARLHAGLGHRHLDARYLRIPEAVECYAEMPEDGSLPRRAKRGQARNLRVLGRSELGWTISRAPGDFEHFYHSMYLPSALRRFGDSACVRRADRLYGHFRRGGLIRVMEGARWVGGTVYSVEGDHLKVMAVGILNGDPRLLDNGVMTANWKFAFERTRHLGLRKCHMGLSRPSLSDGVLIYKKRWGAGLSAGQPTPYDLFVRWDTFNHVIAQWLKAHPIVIRDGNGFSALTSLQEPTAPESVERLALELAIPGLNRLDVATPNLEVPESLSPMDGRLSGLDLRVVPQTSSASMGRALTERTDTTTLNPERTRAEDESAVSAGDAKQNRHTAPPVRFW